MPSEQRPGAQNAPTPPARGKLVWTAIGLLSVAIFMFVSIIVKTALKGP